MQSSGELPPGPHERDGLAISFWTHVRPDPDREVTFADCASMLVDLHAAMRTYPGDLPVLAPAANDIARGLDALDGADDLIDADEAASLRGAVDEMWPLFERPPGDLQPLHGDVHPGNMVTSGRTTLEP
ncbi:MAG: phosphotransferase [Streptosporangiales bacterium]|nr:phosphotransferase [Streptosporangiales bacterium]